MLQKLSDLPQEQQPNDGLHDDEDEVSTIVCNLSVRAGEYNMHDAIHIKRAFQTLLCISNSVAGCTKIASYHRLTCSQSYS